jgi:hypothetical protein
LIIMSVKRDNELDDHNEAAKDGTCSSPPEDQDKWIAMAAMGFTQVLRSDGTLDLCLPTGEVVGQIKSDYQFLDSGDDGEGWNADQLGHLSRVARLTVATPPPAALDPE